MISIRKFLVTFFLTGCLLLASCSQQTSSRFDDAQQASTSKGATAVVDDSQSGGAFNRYFPSSGDGYERVYSQEKQGYAQAKLTKDGKEIAILSISDVINNSSTVAKFQDSSSQINGYPAVSQGKSGTAVLVNDRYQVKIRSKDNSFDSAEREKWLGQFDLRGLSKLN
ncbi:MAG: hypothetical protein AAF383_22490 [Cyanobacteria bacterium P01_A01_bin.83]